jgi:alkanesulfonate monooxygenase SsuD/methylene tetrahydromethanopterin reductase-like flavin-dependent oxidoreductase (luciferase family)
MPTGPRPALCIVASPGRRAAILELATEAERRGFAGIACPSLGGAMSLAASLAHVTERIPFWTSVQPIYLAHATEAAVTASHIYEVSGGRFALGLGVSHERSLARRGLVGGKPLEDVARYVADVQAASGEVAAPIYLAAMRDKMLGLATEIAAGAIWANAALSAMAAQFERVPATAADGFFRANMVPTVIDEDRASAAAVNRRTMVGYVVLPNYRNYWNAVGYEEEMATMEEAIEARERDRLPSLMSDRWLRDVTLSGTATDVREGIEAWSEAGVLPIAVPSSTTGGQTTAIQELFAAYA